LAGESASDCVIDVPEALGSPNRGVPSLFAKFQARLQMRQASGDLAVGQVVRSTGRAENRDVMDLAFLRIEQDGAAIAAREIDRVIACIEDGRSTDDGARWRTDGLEADLRMYGQRTFL